MLIEMQCASVSLSIGSLAQVGSPSFQTKEVTGSSLGFWKNFFYQRQVFDFMFVFVLHRKSEIGDREQYEPRRLYGRERERKKKKRKRERALSVPVFSF